MQDFADGHGARIPLDWRIECRRWLIRKLFDWPRQIGTVWRVDHTPADGYRASDASEPEKSTMNANSGSILIFGCGYLGRRVAMACAANGRQVFSVTRSQDTADEFREKGWQPIIADITKPDSLGDLPETDCVLFAVGFDRTVGIPIEDVYVTGLKNVLGRLPRFSNERQRFIYISSTGVYGQTNGDWVDEDSPCQPERVGGKACLAAEELLQSSQFGNASVILRLAGIYGPGRVPRQKDIIADGEITAATSGFLNLIHVEDAANIVLAAEARATPPALYVVSDGHPVLRGEYYRELGSQLGVPDLKINEVDADSPAGQRARASKRIKSDRVRDELRLSLNYGDYRIGLADSLRVEGDRVDP